MDLATVYGPKQGQILNLGPESGGIPSFCCPRYGFFKKLFWTRVTTNLKSFSPGLPTEALAQVGGERGIRTLDPVLSGILA